MVNDMVNYNSSTLNHTFHALSDPTRRAILARLSQGQATVSEIAKPFSISLPAVTKHITVLESAGLLSRKKEGRTVTCGLIPAPLSEAAAWIQVYERFWQGQLQALANFAENQEGENVG